MSLRIVVAFATACLLMGIPPAWSQGGTVSGPPASDVILPKPPVGPVSTDMPAVDPDFFEKSDLSGPASAPGGSAGTSGGFTGQAAWGDAPGGIRKLPGAEGVH